MEMLLSQQDLTFQGEIHFHDFEFHNRITRLDFSTVIHKKSGEFSCHLTANSSRIVLLGKDTRRTVKNQTVSSGCFLETVRHVRFVTNQDQTSTVTECSYTDFTFRAVQSEYESLVTGKGGVYLCVCVCVCACVCSKKR